MLASYPLVRNLYAFSTRFGVSLSPSRLGSSPRSASSCLIKSCIVLFYISAVTAQSADPPSRVPRFGGASPPSQESRFGEADQLYADRANVSSARRAAQIWRTELAGGGAGAFDAASK